jgi:metal transporter CNNM
MFSGLNLGLLSLDKSELKRKISLGDKNAKKVYSVRKNGNLLLCTLLLGNVGVNSTLAIFLGNITTGIVAGFVATGLIVVFGEIIPQATFSRYALELGAKTTHIVKFFIIILFPVCWPIATILDKILGKEIPTIYSKKELIKIVEEHEDIEGSEIDADEKRIVKGALSFSDKTTAEIMTHKNFVYALEVNIPLTKVILETIKQEGYTRIPIYRQSIDNTIGILYTKDLINIKEDTKIEDIYKQEKILMISKDLKLDKLLRMFIESKTHMAFVRGENNRLDGVVTLEDVIEEIINQEIHDESDQV